MTIKKKNIISEEEQGSIKGWITVVITGILVLVINPYLPCDTNPLLASTCNYIKEKICL